MATSANTADKDTKAWKGTDRRQILSEEFEKLMTKIEESVTPEQAQKVKNITGVLTSEMNMFKRKVKIQESEINKLRQTINEMERSLRKHMASKDEEISQLNLECKQLKQAKYYKQKDGALIREYTSELYDQQKTVNKLKKENTELKESVASKAKADEITYKQKEDALTREYTRELYKLQQKVNQLEKENTKLKENVESKTTKDETDVKQKVDSLIRKYKDELLTQQQKAKQLEKETNKIKENTERVLHDERKKRKDMEQQLNEKLSRRDKDIQRLRDECEELKTRLSKHSNSNKLTDVNPNIPDLSDVNRPLKLAERYNELYDNEWTDALETVKKDRETYHYSEGELEKEAISILLQVLKEVWQFCKDEFREQDMQVREALFRERDDKRYLPEEFTRQLKSTKKELAIESTDAIYKKFLRRKPRVSDYLVSHIQVYVKECTKLCWLMTNQDPPMDFEMTTRKYESFDSKKYREYMKGGSCIEFVVWPPMLLHENGPVMAKGVAQGLKLTRKEDVSPKYGDYAVENLAYPITKTEQAEAYDDYGKLSRNQKPVDIEVIPELSRDDVHGSLGKYGDNTVESRAYPISKIKQKEACAGNDDKVNRYQKPVYREVIPELSRDDAYEHIGNAGDHHNNQAKTSSLKRGPNEATRCYHKEDVTPVNQHGDHRSSHIWSREKLLSKLDEGSSRYLPSNAEYDRYLNYLEQGWSRKLIRSILGDLSYEKCTNFEQLLTTCS